MESKDLPRRTLRPTQTNDKVAIDALIPVHGEGTGIEIGAEGAQIAVVILDVVGAARATSNKVRLGIRLCLWLRYGSCHRVGGEEPSQCCGELHVG